MAEQSPGPARLAWQQVVVLVTGALYTVFGIVGFFVLGDASTALAGRNTGDTLLGLELNAIQNVVHIVLGVAGLLCAAGLQRSRGYGIVLLVAGAVLSVFGIVAVGNDALNVLSVNWPDTVLHGLTAVLGLAIIALPAGLVAQHVEQGPAR